MSNLLVTKSGLVASEGRMRPKCLTKLVVKYRAPKKVSWPGARLLTLPLSKKAI